jgi:hypothetical protein
VLGLSAHNKDIPYPAVLCTVAFKVFRHTKHSEMFYEGKTTKHLKKEKPERYWPKLSKKGLVYVKNHKHINGFILNNVVFY